MYALMNSIKNTIKFYTSGEYDRIMFKYYTLGGAFVY